MERAAKKCCCRNSPPPRAAVPTGVGGLSLGFPGLILGSMGERMLFDTHRFVRDLVAAGMAEAIAETLAEKQVELLTSELATRVGVAQVEANLKAELATTNERIAQVEANLKAELATTNERIAQVEANLKAELEQITMLCSRPSFLRKQESSPTPRSLDAGSRPA